MQVFRPDRVESALNIFVSDALGLTSIGGLVWSFKSILKDEPTPDVPILFVIIINIYLFVCLILFRLLLKDLIPLKSLKNLLKMKLVEIISNKCQWEVIKMTLQFSYYGFKLKLNNLIKLKYKILAMRQKLENGSVLKIYIL